MVELKGLRGIGTIAMLGGTAFAVYYLRRLISAIHDLHRDISVIRLDNSRTMAELRRRHR